MTTKVLGLRELQAEIARLNRDLEQAEDPASMAAGSPIAEKWKALVPVDEGNYRESIAVAWQADQRRAAIGTSMVGGLPRNEQPFIYAPRLEYGDSEMTAQPAARPALKQAREEAKAAAADVLGARLRGRRPKARV